MWRAHSRKIRQQNNNHNENNENNEEASIAESNGFFDICDADRL